MLLRSLSFKFFACFLLLSFVIRGNCETYRNYISDEYKQNIVESIPRTLYEINLFGNETKERIEKAFSKIQHQNSNDLSFESTILAYDLAGKGFFSDLGVLSSLNMIYQDAEMADIAMYKCVQLWDYFFNLIEDQQLIYPIVTYIEKSLDNPNYLPSEIHYFKNFLEGTRNFEYEYALEQKIKSLSKRVSEKVSVGFTSINGKASEKLSDSNNFSLLTWNICALPGKTSMLFGGVFPWESRIQNIIKMILEQDADVVCLQEVFTEEAAEKIIKGLESRYSYFKVNIGSRNLGLTDDSIGLGSGLFVASKYKIANENWTSYKDIYLTAINRGCFDFTIENGSKKARIFTTHLESSVLFKLEDDFRQLQLKQILSNCESYDLLKSGPTILCGDMNIYFGTNESAEKTMNDYFYDSYSHSIIKVTDENCTYCDFTGNWWPEYIFNHNREVFYPKQDILDYVLLLKKLPSGETLEKYSINTIRIAVHEVDDPAFAVSDHHALFSIISWDPQ